MRRKLCNLHNAFSPITQTLEKLGICAIRL